MPLPLVGRLLQAYNNLPAIPPDQPLGDLLNSILTSEQSQTFKTAVRAASVTGENLALSGLVDVDEVTPVEGDRILAKDQTVATENGIYVAGAGAWTRSTDADNGTKLADASIVYAKEGTQNANTAWQLITDDPITLGVTSLDFEEFTPPTTFMDSVRMASITGDNLPLSGMGPVDGVGTNTGDRILAKSQNDPIENGIYIVGPGAWERAPDASDGGRLSASSITFVQEGAINRDTAWQLTTNNPVIIGTTALTFAQFGAALSRFAANAAGNVTTSASNFTTVPLMDIPNIGVGTYFVWFTTDVEASATGVSVEVNISVNNAEVPNSRRIFTRRTDNLRVPLSCAALVTVATANDDLRIQWRRQPGGGPPPTITMGNRAVLVIKVS